MRKPSRVWLQLWLILIISGSAIGYFFWSNRTILYSDPNAPRTDPGTESNWDAAFGQDKAAPIPWNADTIVTESDFKFVDTSDSFAISYDDGIEGGNSWVPVPTKIIKVPKDTQTVQLPTGETISLKHIATGYRTGETEQVSRTFEATKLVPVLPTILKEDRVWQYGPTFMADFKTSSYLHFIEEMRIFNRATKVMICRSDDEYQDSKNRLTIVRPTVQWHPSPISFVLDVDGGRKLHRKVPLEVGQIIKTPSVTIQMIFIKEFSGTVETTSYPQAHGRKIIQLNRKKKKSGITTVIGFAVTEKRWIPSAITIRPKSEKVNWGIYIDGATISQNMFFVDFPATISEIDFLNLASPMGSFRMIFDLETIPGLPEENSNLTNLFDVTIPNYRHDNNRYQWISRTAHLQNRLYLPVATMTGASVKLDNATLREITLAWKKRENIFSIQTTPNHSLKVYHASPWAKHLHSIRSLLP